MSLGQSHCHSWHLKFVLKFVRSRIVSDPKRYQAWWVLKFVSTNDHYDKTIYHTQDHFALSNVKVTVRNYSLCIGFSETCLWPANNFVVKHASGMV